MFQVQKGKGNTSISINFNNQQFYNKVNVFKTRMHSSRMCTAHSLTVSPYLVVSHACPNREQPHMPPEQPCMPQPGATTHAPQSNHTCPPMEQPCMPPRSNHTPYLRISSYAMHAPPGATTHVPQEQPCMPPRATTHAPWEQPCTQPPQSNHAPPQEQQCMAPEQPCTPTSNYAHPPLWTE